MDRKPGLVVFGDYAYVIYQGDNALGRFKSIDESFVPTSNIYIAAQKLPPSKPIEEQTNNTRVLVDKPNEPTDEYEPAALRQQYGEDRPTRSIDYDGQKLNLYYGDLHEHTEISICNREGDQSLDESYQSMRDIAKYDFCCITDHGYKHEPVPVALLGEDGPGERRPGQVSCLPQAKNGPRRSKNIRTSTPTASSAIGT